jgi:acetyl esterase/lipase
MIRPMMLAIALAAPAACLAADDRAELPLWPGAAPGSEGITANNVTVDRGKDGKHSYMVTQVHKPTLTVYLPPRDKGTGAAIIVCPGGGHRYLAIDHEGHDVGRWLSGIGVAGFVLKYRLARAEGSKYKVETHALDDAKRAVRLVRSRAAEWGVESAKIGIMGFSAGGEVAALASTRVDTGSAGAQDPVDRLSSRPSFAVLVYPGFRPETLTVTKETPPTFMVYADDDRLGANRSASYYLALKKAGVSSELHIYARGGHGFGIRDNHQPVSSWPVRCQEWLADRGFTH